MPFPGEYYGPELLPVVKHAIEDACAQSLRLLETFGDPIALLKAAETMGLGGIVSKLRNDRYRSGTNKPEWRH